MEDSSNDKPVLLKAVELVLAEPADIKRETESLLKKFAKEHPSKSTTEVRSLVVKKIISNYSYFAAFSGGATALTGIVPGLGTALATFGGATVDVALSMKYQIEMTMAIAVAYGHDILVEEKKRVCMMVAGLGTIAEAGKEGGKSLASKAFIRLAKEYLTGSTLQALKEIFKKIGIIFTQKAAVKAIPFGVGVVIGFTANKGLAAYVGRKARDFFEAEA